MSKSKGYYLKWKGHESGPFTREELEEMLACGRVGLLHHIRRDDGEWVYLKDFDITSISSEDCTCASENEQKCPPLSTNILFQYLMYALSGASFISLYFYVAVLCFCCVLFYMGDRKATLLFFILSTVMFILGQGFFILLYPQLQ